MRPRFAHLLALFLLAAPAAPVAAEQSLLKSVVFRLPGTWRGEGSYGGAAAHFDLTWTPVIDGMYLRVHTVSTFKSREGDDRRFEGEGTLVAAPDEAGKRAGWWLDSQGTRRALVATTAGDSLVTEWAGDDGARGRSTYRLLADGTLQVRDEQLRQDKWVTFVLGTLSRAPATAH